MNSVATAIPLANLALAFIPVGVVIYVLNRWSLCAGNAVHAILRMLIQLLLVGYFLTYIFASDSAWMVFGILMLMVLVSSWIALGSVKENRLILYKYAFISIALGGGLVFVIITQGVLQMDKWYSPLYTIPIAGMVFANSMNCVSLAAERIHSEMSRGVEYLDARRMALQTSLIPITNSLFAVGVVSLPGMMTGQILSGVSPLIAARYQIMVMCMIFAASGISTIMFLTMGKTIFVAKSSSDASN